MSCRRAAGIDLAAFEADRRAPEWDGFRAHYPGCADCARAVAGWARLREALAASAGEDLAHLGEAEMLALADGTSGLPAARRRAIEAHLARCAPCRSELAVLRGFDLAALGAIAAPAREPEPGLAERWRERLESWLAPLRQPAFALAVLLLLAVPAGVAMWRLWWAGDPARTPPPIAREEPAPIAPSPPGPIPVAEPPELAREPVVEDEPAVPDPAPAEAESAPVVAEREPVAEPEPEPLREGVSQQIAESSEPEPALPPAPEPIAQAPEPLDLAALLPDEPPAYHDQFTVAAAPFAGESTVRGASEELPTLRPLAPSRGGATARPAPTLYWDLSAPSPVPVELTLIEEDGIEPLVELRLEAPVAAGLHALSLAERGVALDPGTTYAWYATLVPDIERRDLDVVSGAAIRYVPASPDLERRLEQAGPARRAHVLAEAGYWIDAFDALARIARAHPEAARAGAQQAALLEQVGLAPATEPGHLRSGPGAQ